MLTFNSDNAFKSIVVDYASKLRLPEESGTAFAHVTRRDINWSMRTWCQATYSCKGGASCDHRFYADEIGVPVAIAYGERQLFLNLPRSAAVSWAPKFLRAIPVGVDLEAASVWKKLALFALADKQNGIINLTIGGEQYDAVKDVIGLYEQESSDADAWKNASEVCEKIFKQFARSADSYQDKAGNPTYLRAGFFACEAAYYFACCFADQRFAAEAIVASSKAFRDCAYCDRMISKRSPFSDTRARSRDAAAHSNAAQSNHIMAIADHLVGLLRASEETAGRNWLSRFLGKLC